MNTIWYRIFLSFGDRFVVKVMYETIIFFYILTNVTIKQKILIFYQKLFTTPIIR